MFVETIEARLIDQIEDGLFGMRDRQGGVTCRHITIGLHREHRTEVDALVGIACGMTCHRELGRDGFDMMGHLCRQGNLAVDVATEADSYQLVRIGGKVFSGDNFPFAYIPIFNNGRVKAQ